jgi:hypothetical protein
MKTNQGINRSATREGLREIEFPGEDSFGFAGTIQSNSYDEATGQNGIDIEAAKRLWAKACEAVARVFEETDANVVRNFLRAPAGRHLADEAYSEAYPERDEASLADGIGKALRRRRVLRGGKLGRLAWQKEFDGIRKATLDGTWVD